MDAKEYILIIMQEKALIETLIQPLLRHEYAMNGLDDCGYFDSQKWVITSDIMVENCHFFSHDHGDDVAYKLLHVNISDIISSGAKPRFAHLNYSFDPKDIQFSQVFFATFKQLCDAYSIHLLGGDTVKALQYKKFFSLTLIGELQQNKPWLRTKAYEDDDIWVTNYIGDSFCGLDMIKNILPQNTSDISDSMVEYFVNAYKYPVPPVHFAFDLIDNKVQIHACMDISDGLFGDIYMMAKASEKGMVIYEKNIPLSPYLIEFINKYTKNKQDYYSQGDDYQLLFTAPKHQKETIMTYADKHHIKVSCIGYVQSEPGCWLYDDNGKLQALPMQHYNHE